MQEPTFSVETNKINFLASYNKIDSLPFKLLLLHSLENWVPYLFSSLRWEVCPSGTIMHRNGARIRICVTHWVLPIIKWKRASLRLFVASYIARMPNEYTSMSYLNRDHWRFIFVKKIVFRRRRKIWLLFMKNRAQLFCELLNGGMVCTTNTCPLFWRYCGIPGYRLGRS